MRPSARLLASRLPEALGFYRHQFGPAPLLLGVAAAAALAVRLPGLAVPFGLALAGSFLFALNFRLDPFLAETYHCNAFLLLATALGSGLAGLPRGRWSGVLAGTGLFLALTAAVLRLPSGWAGRDYALFDLDRHILLSAPRGAILFAGSDYDHFGARYLTGPAGLRPDLRLEDMPGTARRDDSWNGMLARVAPGRTPPPEVSTDMAARTQVLASLAPAGTCLAFSALGDEFTAFPARARGLVLIPARAECARGTGPGLGPWRGFTFRGAFGRRALQPWNLTILRVHGRALDRTALALLAEGRKREALSAAALRSRLLPQEAESWLTRAIVLASAGRGEESFDCLDRSCRLDPGFAPPLLLMLRSVRAARSWDRLPALDARIRAFLRLAPYPVIPRPTPPGEVAAIMARVIARELLARGDETAAGGGPAVPGSPPDDPRRRTYALSCYLESARLDPEWEEPLGRAAEMAILLMANEQAWEVIRTWRRAFPRSPTALLTEATMRVIGREPSRAVPLLKEALRLDPGLEEAQRLLAEIRAGKR
jgi:tetratricopeptide (TPR) repeat protein